MARATSEPLLTLDRYREIVRPLPLWAFNGIENPNEAVSGCDRVWAQWEREELARALWEAESLLKTHLGYSLGLAYEDDTDLEWTAGSMRVNWGYVVGGGIRGRTEVTPTAWDFTTEDATITVTAADFPGGTSEIVLVETDTGYKIDIDDVTASGADYIITVSQAKLVRWEMLQNQTADNPIAYPAAWPDTTNFLSEVVGGTWANAGLTVYREYRDTSVQAELEFQPYVGTYVTDCWGTCSGTCSTEPCAGTTQTACIYVLDSRNGIVRIQPADYNADTETWTRATSCVCCYDGIKVRARYLAGATGKPGQEMAVVHLAHTLMSFTPCGCDTARLMWDADRHQYTLEEGVTGALLACPFGRMNGAWRAWQWVLNNRLGHGGLL